MTTFRVLTPSRVLGAILLLLSGVVTAQNIQLSAEQEFMLNQLPPAQRQQAMQALRQLKAGEPGAQQTINETIQEYSLPEDPESEGEEILRATAKSRIVLSFELPEELRIEEIEDIEDDPIMQRLVGSHLYVLDESGVLALPGLDHIPLLGLSEEDIVHRLATERYLSAFEIEARILGQEPIGVEALKPFGYDVFEPRESRFDAPSSGPVPSDYVLGPGDSVRVQLFGNVNGIYEHEVSRDGVLNLPEIGPVTVAGVPFSEFRRDLDKRVSSMLIGTQVSVTMGQLRTIRVFVLGDVNEPGSYVVNGLSTISGALDEGGGISEVGTLRNILLKRAGRTVETLDLYDLLLNGDTSSDVRLQPGDVVFVPPVGTTVSVAGAVKRPAIYETRGKTSISDIVRIAGGLAPEAFAEGARLERVEGSRKTIAVNLTDPTKAERLVRAGDTLLVPEVLPSFEETVTLAGHVYRGGNFQWWPGMRLTDLIGSSDELMPGVDPEYVLVRRERERGRPIEAVSANLRAALIAPGSDEDIRLEASDQVHVFSLALGRQRIVEPLMDELRLQATTNAPASEVEVAGDVRAPGVYPLEEGMRVSDLIRAGGSLTEAAYAAEAELTRYSSDGVNGRTVEVISIDLDAIRKQEASADYLLKAHDYLIVNRVPDWDKEWTVALEGEVRFPGEYRIRRDETLAELLVRAGGLVDNAFPEGAIFLRESLKERERDQIETLARRMEADLASLSLQDATTGGSDALTTGKVLLDQLHDTEPVGRLVIDLESARDIKLRDGDRLLVPTQSQVVTVIGETQQNTSHLYRENLSRNDYIDLSGGFTRRADRKLVYVVRANGAVIAGNRSRWLGRARGVDIQPGDTIVVPLDTDRMRPLTFWGSVTQILYQGAIAVAAVQTFNN